MRSSWIPNSIPNDLLEVTIFKDFDKVEVHVESKDVQVKKITTGLFKIQQQKRQSSNFSCQGRFQMFGPSELDFPEGTRIFINDILCAYYGVLWNICKKLKGMGKLNVIFVSNGTVKVKMFKNDPVSITHAADLKKMFPGIDINNLQFVCREQFSELIFFI